jgi:hypothetical protein
MSKEKKLTTIIYEPVEMLGLPMAFVVRVCDTSDVKEKILDLCKGDKKATKKYKSLPTKLSKDSCRPLIRKVIPLDYF